MSENFRKEKSVSRSSSGIGTATLSSRGQRKVSSDDTSSRCFSPSLKNEIIDELSDAEKDLNDNYEDDDLADLPHKEKKKRMKQLGDSRFGSLKTLKKALSKKITIRRPTSLHLIENYTILISRTRITKAATF